MTSTKTRSSTKQVFQPLPFFVTGLALCVFGVVHCLSGYPGPEVFIRFAGTLPLLWAVASFAVGIAAALAGLALLLPSLLGLGRRRQPRPPVYPGPTGSYADRAFSAGRQGPARYEDDFDPDALGEEDYQGAGGGYGDGYGGNGDGRPHDNGTLDPRQRAGTYR